MKNRTPATAVLHVEMHTGEKVFRLGNKLRIDQLNPYDMLTLQPNIPPEKDRTSIEVFREGTLFDKAVVQEFGTHAASHLVIGLEKICADVPRFGGTVILANLCAKWFTEGDILHLSCPARDIRNRILYNWQEQLLKLPQYVEKRRAASRALSAIMVTLNEKRRSGSLSDQRWSARSKHAWRHCFSDLFREIGTIPIPEVIHWQR